jgi:hypothetical protein
MDLQEQFGRKPLFNMYDDVKFDVFKSIATFVGHTRIFLETVKVIFQQKGFVSKGISANIRIAPKPIHFMIQ